MKVTPSLPSICAVGGSEWLESIEDPEYLKKSLLGARFE